MNSIYARIVIGMLFLSILFLSGLITNIRGEEDKTAIKNGYSENNQYKEKAKQKLDEFDKKIGELEIKAKEAGSNAKSEADKDLMELKKKRSTLKNAMVRLEASSKKTWETAKRKVNRAINDLEKTYDKVRAHYK
jgi:hypothetical protein